MARPKLHVRYRDGTEPQAAVFQEIEGVVTQLGDDFGSSDPANAFSFVTNGAIHFQDRIYAYNNDRIWEYVPASGAAAAWTPVYAYASPDSSTGHRTGFFPVLKDGEPHLVAMYRVSSTNCRGVFISSSGTFSETSNKTYTDGRFGTPLVFQNQLYWNLDGRHNFFDPDGETVSVGSVWSTDGAGESQAVMMVFEGNLYGMQANLNLAANTYKIHQIQGTAVSELFDFGISNFSFQGGTGKNAAFTDGINLYHIGHLNAADGWELARVDLVQEDGVDLSDRLPLGMQGGSSSQNGRVWIYNDIEDGNNEIVMAWSDDDNDSDGVNFYRWDGESTGFTFLGSAGASSWAIVNDTQGGGHRTFAASGELSPQLTGFSTIGTSVQLNYKIFGDNEDDVAVEWKFDRLGEQPQIQCSLSNPSQGSLSGNFVTGLTADGSGVYSVRWLAGSQGVQPGDFPTIVPRAVRL